MGHVNAHDGDHCSVLEQAHHGAGAQDPSPRHQLWTRGPPYDRGQTVLELLLQPLPRLCRGTPPEESSAGCDRAVRIGHWLPHFGGHPRFAHQTRRVDRTFQGHRGRSVLRQRLRSQCLRSADHHGQGGHYCERPVEPRLDHRCRESFWGEKQVRLSKLIKASELQKTPKANGEHPNILIITDGVFSMDGDLAPLPHIVDLAKKYDALTMVDDAHGEGVLGVGGRGIVNHFGLEGEVDIEIGSLSKAFSVMGGFIAAKQPLIDCYLMQARQRLFSIALTIPDTAALVEAVNMLEESDHLMTKLWGNVDYLNKGFTDLGFDIGHSETPIIPVMLGDEDRARAFSAKLFEEGVFASAICFPMVPKGTARVRVIVSASFSKADCDQGLAAFKKVHEEMK